LSFRNRNIRFLRVVSFVGSFETKCTYFDVGYILRGQEYFFNKFVYAKYLL